MVDNIVALSRENLDKVGIEHGRFFVSYNLVIAYPQNATVIFPRELSIATFQIH